MLNPEFPLYADAQIASRCGCFQCHSNLDESTIKDDEYPNGRYSMACIKCNMRTWFDLVDVVNQP